MVVGNVWSGGHNQEAEREEERTPAGAIAGSDAFPPVHDCLVRKTAWGHDFEGDPAS